MDYKIQIISIAFILVALTLETQCLKEEFCHANICPKGHAHIDCGLAKKSEYYFSEHCDKCVTFRRLLKDVDRFFVPIHNEYRNEQAELHFAARMSMVRWSDTLARLAEFSERKCNKTAHDQCHNTKDYRHVAQNIDSTDYVGNYQDPLQIELGIGKIMKQWYDESKNCPSFTKTERLIASYQHSGESNKCSRFATMMQEQIIEIGCAVVEELRREHNVTLHVVCNYSYGNQIGKPIFKRSSPNTAIDCDKASEMYPNLCEEYTYDVY